MDDMGECSLIFDEMVEVYTMNKSLGYMRDKLPPFSKSTMLRNFQVRGKFSIYNPTKFPYS